MEVSALPLPLRSWPSKQEGHAASQKVLSDTPRSTSTRRHTSLVRAVLLRPPGCCSSLPQGSWRAWPPQKARSPALGDLLYGTPIDYAWVLGCLGVLLLGTAEDGMGMPARTWIVAVVGRQGDIYTLPTSTQPHGPREFSRLEWLSRIVP